MCSSFFVTEMRKVSVFVILSFKYGSYINNNGSSIACMDETLVLQTMVESGGNRLSKIYVLDTNVLLQDPLSLFSFDNNEVVIPAVVLEEVDSKKRYMDEVGRNARYVSKLIDKFREIGKLHDSIPLENGGTFRIELNHRSFVQLQDIFVEKTNDNRILAVAKNLSLEEQAKENGRPVILVSKDVLVRVKADALGLQA